MKLPESMIFVPEWDNFIVIWKSDYDISYCISYYPVLPHFRDDVPLLVVDRTGKIIQDNGIDSLRLLALLFSSKNYEKFRAG